MNELAILEKMFGDKNITTFQWDGQQPFWIAKELGQALGYAENGESLTNLIRQGWSDEFEEGQDFEILKGEKLAELKKATTLVKKGELIDPRVPALLILYESGIYGVRLKTDKPEGKRLRRWLRDEVFPSLRRTGGYQSQPRSTKEVFEAYKPAVLEAMAKKAVEGSIEATQLYLKLGRPSHHKKPNLSPSSPTPPRAAPKTEQIQALLLSGLSPKEVVKQGFTKAHVYLIAARLRAKKPD